MTSNNNVVLCMGTRPEIIKMMPVYAALTKQGVNAQIVHSGQHEEMAWSLYDFFQMQPTESIQLVRQNHSLAHLSALLLEKLSEVFMRLSPAIVLVHGDTSSALMGALAAFYMKIPVGHVEAGLRTNCQYDPFPEEMNRNMIGRIAQWHFAPTEIAAENLRREFVQGEVSILGNTAVDAAQWGVTHLEKYSHAHPDFLPPEFIQFLEYGTGKKLLLVTAHRRENWGQGIHNIATAIKQWLETNEEYFVIWPVHPNPDVSKTIYEALFGLTQSAAQRLILCKPIEYPALLWVLQRAWLVLTDSGGIQEEASSLDKPVLILRETTERPEIIHSGRGLLVGTEIERILDNLQKLHSDMIHYQRMLRAPNPFGDGKTGEKITSILNKWLYPVEADDQDLSCISIA